MVAIHQNTLEDKTMSYNGHKNWNHWNVSLWISNDEGLYNLARENIRQARTKDQAAEYLLETLHSCGVTETPDGAPYTKSSIRAALVDL